ncbi:hypothetical protein CR513_53586, partial [Mucuna pruriens]
MATWDALLGERRAKSEPLKITTRGLGVEPLVETAIASKTSQEIVGGVNQDPRARSPHRGTIATIVRGGSMAKMLAASQKRPTKRQDPPITFTDEDYEGTIPHSDDPMVISVVMVDYKVEWLLVDQGSSANVLF